MSRLARRALAALALAAVLVTAAPAGALACPLPCVEVTNDYPYVYAKLCPPV